MWGYSSHSGNQSTIQSLSPTISKVMRTISLGLVTTNRPGPFAKIRFLVTTKAEMPLESMKVRPDRSMTREEPATSTSASANPSAETMSNSPRNATT